MYVVNDNAAGNQIYGYNVNETTGALALLAGFPVASGGNGGGIFPSELLTIDRANRRLYVINDGSDTVSAYSINPATSGYGGGICAANTGVLTLLGDTITANTGGFGGGVYRDTGTLNFGNNIIAGNTGTSSSP